MGYRAIIGVGIGIGIGAVNHKKFIILPKYTPSGCPSHHSNIPAFHNPLVANWCVWAVMGYGLQLRTTCIRLLAVVSEPVHDSVMHAFDALLEAGVGHQLPCPVDDGIGGLRCQADVAPQGAIVG